MAIREKVRWEDDFDRRGGWRMGSDYYGNDPQRYASYCGHGSAHGPGRDQFRGRGPQGYRRSNERIREEACELLTQDDWVDASNIEVTVSESEITLSGGVSSREQKRRAEDLVERLPGVRDVHNRLSVVPA
jgi:osmotically-inducible protein OsmY